MVLDYNKSESIKNDYTVDEFKHLNLLAEKFPTVQAVCTEIINLESILNLPKGTEHFLTDIHGAYETFSHVLRNAFRNGAEKDRGGVPVFAG